MKSIRTIQAGLLTFMILLILAGCEKEENNQLPTIHFLEPDNNLIIEHDTVLSIVVEPFDEDGVIKRVELFINGALITTFVSAPYQYEAVLDNVGICNVKAIAYDNKETAGEEEIIIEIKDFRIKFYGDFNFRTITEFWMLGQPTTYDTSFYDGIIRKYEYIDSENDLYPDDDSGENPEEKITIEFMQNTKITSLINTNGILTPRTGYHYGHGGEFVTIDTIEFYIGGFGGLGTGYNYEIQGIRIE